MLCRAKCISNVRPQTVGRPSSSLLSSYAAADLKVPLLTKTYSFNSVAFWLCLFIFALKCKATLSLMLNQEIVFSSEVTDYLRPVSLCTLSSPMYRSLATISLLPFSDRPSKRVYWKRSRYLGLDKMS